MKLSKEAANILQMFASNPQYVSCICGNLLDEILLYTGGDLICRGKLYYFSTNQLSPNVWSVGLKSY